MKTARKRRSGHVVKFDPRDPTIVGAIRIIGPAAGKRDAFSRDVLSAMYSIGEADERRTWTTLERTKPGKAAAKMLGRALRHVERVCLDKNIEIPAPLMLNPFTLSKLVELAERCEEVVKAPSGSKLRRDAEAKRDAVHHAHGLMKKYEVPIRGEKGIGKFCKLSALLLNDREADLTSHCRAYIRSLKKGEKRAPK